MDLIWSVTAFVDVWAVSTVDVFQDLFQKDEKIMDRFPVMKLVADNSGAKGQRSAELQSCQEGLHKDALEHDLQTCELLYTQKHRIKWNLL